MRDQEIIGLWEAYQQVHAQPEEVEQLDEIKQATTVANDKIPNFQNGKKAKPVPGLNVPPSPMEEGVDLFDYLLEYLVAEGYADTNKAALAIMANMSEEWKQSIIEDVYMGPPKKPPGDSGTETPKKPGMETPNKQKPFEKNPPMSAPELGFDTSDPIINYRRGYYPDGSRVPSPKVPRSAPAPKPGPRGRVY